MAGDGFPGGASVVQRVLSNAQATTRNRLLEAAIDLATHGGYDAVTVRDVAARSGVSPATAYQYFGSKDQLLVDALLALGGQVRESVHTRPPEGKLPADRLIDVFHRVMRGAEQRPLLYQALFRAYLATPPINGGIDGLAGFGPERAAWIGDALRAGDLGDHDEEDLQSIARLASFLFLAAMVSVGSGRPPSEVADLLDEAVAPMMPGPRPAAPTS